MDKINRFLKNVLLLGFVVLLLFAYYDLRDLGKNVALYRDAEGQVLQAITYNVFFYAPMLFLVFLNIIISGIAKLVKGLPYKKMKLPNRAFWFDEKDRSDKLEVVFVSWVYGFAIIINLLFIVLMMQIWMTNRGLGGQLSQYGIITLVFVVIFIVWGAFLGYRLRLNKEEFIE